MEQEQYTKTPYSILVTGTRAPSALELCWRLNQAGCRIYTVDSTFFRLCKNLPFIEESFKCTSPRRNASRFVEDLNQIILKHKISCVVPTCEEAFYLSFFKSEIKATVITEGFEMMQKLHQKDTFIELCEKVWENTPKTVSYDCFKNEISNYVLKRKFSRFGLDIYFSSKAIPKIKGSQSKWIAQEFIEGRELSSYVICHKGQITLSCHYHQVAKINGGASVAFQSIDSAKLNLFVEQFISYYSLSGQISFDFIETNCGKIYPIECNPRTTSGAHLLDESADLLSSMANGKSIYSSTQNKTIGLIKGLTILQSLKLVDLPDNTVDVFSSYKSSKLRTNQFIGIAGFGLKSLLSRKSLAQSMVDDIFWDGEEMQ